jgi:hypothetical protein
LVAGWPDGKGAGAALTDALWLAGAASLRGARASSRALPFAGRSVLSLASVPSPACRPDGTLRRDSVAAGRLPGGVSSRLMTRFGSSRASSGLGKRAALAGGGAGARETVGATPSVVLASAGELVPATDTCSGALTGTGFGLAGSGGDAGEGATPNRVFCEIWVPAASGFPVLGQMRRLAMWFCPQWMQVLTARPSSLSQIAGVCPKPRSDAGGR